MKNFYGVISDSRPTDKLETPTIVDLHVNIRQENIVDELGVSALKWVYDVIRLESWKEYSDFLDAQLRKTTSQLELTSSIAFVIMAQSEQLDEETILEHPSMFPLWDKNWRGKAGAIVQDEGMLFKSIHDVKDSGQNTKPSKTPSMWTKIGNPAEEYPEWSQPIGAHDAYGIGDKVTYNEKKYVSTAKDNVWRPDVYGWKEATE